MALSISASGMSLGYKFQTLVLDNQNLQYKAQNIKFELTINDCSIKLATKFFERFKFQKNSKLDLVKIEKIPVSYRYEDKNVKTYQGSKVHSKLEKLQEDALLLKYRLEQKC